jgi:hypothetical protein
MIAVGFAAVAVAAGLAAVAGFAAGACAHAANVMHIKLRIANTLRIHAPRE